LREFLSFEDATAASQSQSDERFLFKALLKVDYHQPDQGYLFDMATGQYLPDNAIVASHNFLYKWGHRISHYTPFKDIKDVRNGLLLYKPVGWAFNRAKLCIEVSDAARMTFRLLDYDLHDVKLADLACKLLREPGCDDLPTGKQKDLQTTFGDLDGQEVQFPVGSIIRPSKQLLGLHAIAAWVQAQSQTYNSEIPVPECSTSDVGDAKVPFIEAWRLGLPESGSVSGSQATI
jgi:hypothetical protein